MGGRSIWWGVFVVMAMIMTGAGLLGGPDEGRERFMKKCNEMVADWTWCHKLYENEQ
jgi:hypothetical protein